jgi:hypothetical protein
MAYDDCSDRGALAVTHFQNACRPMLAPISLANQSDYVESNRNPLDDVPRHPLLPPVEMSAQN